MQRHIDKKVLPGLLAMVVRQGKIGYLQCFGMADLEAARAMQLDTLFRIQSMTKPITSVAVIPITSVAVMMLYEEGHFRLTDSVAQYIPEFSDTKRFFR